MHAPFSATEQALIGDDKRPLYGALALSLVCLLGLFAWLLAAKLTILVVSDQARLEVEQATYQVQAVASGHVTATFLELGKEVKAGDVLVQLDDSLEQKQRVQELERQRFLGNQLAALDAELAALERALGEERKAAEAAANEAFARARGAAAQSLLAENEAKRVAAEDVGVTTSQVEFARKQTEATLQHATAEALGAAAQRQGLDSRSLFEQRQARLAELHAQQAQLSGVLAQAEANVQSLGVDIDRHVLRAPISGHVAEVSALRVGAVVAAGDSVASVVPLGDLKIVAYFKPAQAFGRITSGQPARMRLVAFPWSEYGVVDARVDKVAQELREGLVRVELLIEHNHPYLMPLQHGLPGSVEIDVEHMSPAMLVLRTAGAAAAGQQETP